MRVAERPAHHGKCDTCAYSVFERVAEFGRWQSAKLICCQQRSRYYRQEVRDTQTCDKHAPEEVV